MKKTVSNLRQSNDIPKQSMSPFGLVTPIKDDSIIESKTKAYVNNHGEVDNYNWMGDYNSSNNLFA
jgi:hypothetical protein